MSILKKTENNRIIDRVNHLLMVICFVSLMVCVFDKTLIEVNSISQNPDYPSGCEAVTAVMCLNYYGYDIDTDAFIDRYLPTGEAPYCKDGIWFSSDPDEVFLGDPRSEKGWGIWAKGLCTSIDNFLDENSVSADAMYTYSETIDSLCRKYVRNDIPVIVWVTVDMTEPYRNVSPVIIESDERFTWISPNHCMLLVGYDVTGYYFNDPMTGQLQKYGKTESERAFEANGSQAVIITCKN